MDTKEIMTEVTKIFNDVLDLDEYVELNEKTTANDVKEWDSLTHIQLVVAIEKHFKTRFTASEIQACKNVGQLCETIEKRINAQN